MAEPAKVPAAMMAAAEALMAEARAFAAGNVHPDHRDGGEEEALAVNLEGTQNAMTAILNASGLPSPHSLRAIGALVGAVLLHYEDEEGALRFIIDQAADVMAQSRASMQPVGRA